MDLHELARDVAGRSVARWLQASVPLIGVRATAEMARSLDIPLWVSLLLLSGRTDLRMR